MASTLPHLPFKGRPGIFPKCRCAVASSYRRAAAPLSFTAAPAERHTFATVATELQYFHPPFL
eukprot:7789318-Pyramimonas_sp.AAC.1